MSRSKLFQRLCLGCCALLVVAVCSWSRAASADKPAGLSAQTLKLPTGPASLKGLGESFSPNLSTGTGNFSIPIQLAPGALAPKISLSYTAGKGKGPVGLSFDLPVLNISRTTDKGAPDYDEDDRFSVSGPGLNDELVRVNKALGYYRLKNEGAFALFVRDPLTDSWTIRMPNGQTLLLGTGQGSRQTANGRTFRWYIERHEDQFSHAVAYEYERDQGRLYLSSIHYQLHAPAARDRNRVELRYETRPDVFTDYSYGAAITTAWRLTDIDVFHGERRLRTYALSYGNEELFSLLERVEMQGEGADSMPPLTFSYVERSSASGGLTEMRFAPPVEALLDGRAQFADMNGDGLPDLLVGEADNYRYYENIDGLNWAQTPTPIAGSPDHGLDDPDTVLADINGDGTRDVVYPHNGGFRYQPAGQVRRGWFEGYAAPRDLTTSSGSLSFGSPLLKLGDLNADGRTDLLFQKPGQDSRVINTKNDELVEEAIEELPLDVNFADPRLQTNDFNGDGVLDFVLLDLGPVTSRVRVWHGLGGGHYAPEQSISGVPKGDRAEFSLQDVNRDGQADLVRVSGSWATYYLNTGSGSFTTAVGDFIGLPSVSETQKQLFADINGNGTTDIVWITADDHIVYLDLVGAPYFGMLETVDNGMGMVSTMGYTGSVELAIAAKRAGNPWRFAMPNPMPLVTELSTTDSLDKLGYPATETRTTIEYADGYYDGPEREFRGFAKVIQTDWGDINHPTLLTETRMHVGRNFDTGEDEEILKGKPFAVITRNQAGEIFETMETTYEHHFMCQEDLTGITAKILPNCKVFSDLNQHKDELIAFAAPVQGLEGHWERTQSPRFTAWSTDLNVWGNAVRKTQFGEVSVPPNYVFGEGVDLSAVDVYLGNDEVVAETDYLYNVPGWLIGLPYAQRTASLPGVVLSQARTYYDGEAFVGLPLGQAVVGLASREQIWLDRPSDGSSSGPVWIDGARSEYDNYGQVIAKIDALGNRSELSYDAGSHTFPEVERIYVDSGILTVRAEYDAGYGVITSIENLNGSQSTVVYDGLGRVVELYDEVSGALPSVRYRYHFGTSENPVSTTWTEALVDAATGDYRIAVQYSDGRGGVVLTKTRAETPLGWVAGGYSELSPRGSAVRLFDPYVSPDSRFELPPNGIPFVEHFLDATGRAVRSQFPATDTLGRTYSQTAYLPLEVREYDERDTGEGTLAYPAIMESDGLGRARKAIKFNDLSAMPGVTPSYTELTWSLEYDALGRITAFKDPQWHKSGAEEHRRAYRYDSLGRLLQVQDPNLGTIDYTFDIAGNLLSRVDAKGQTQLWEYGAANRLLAHHSLFGSGDSSGLSDYSYLFYYDAADPNGPLTDATNLLGQLAYVEYPTGRGHYSYDSRGRGDREVRELWDPDSGAFAPQASQPRDSYARSVVYNAAGQVVQGTSPAGMVVSHDYNARGLVSQITSALDGTVRDLLTGAQYDHRGAAVGLSLGNGVSTAKRYDNRGQLTGVLTQLGEASAANIGTSGVGFQHATYQRGYDGQIDAIADQSALRSRVPRLDATYTYDRLYQLTEADNADGVHKYAYDLIQNFVAREVEGGAPAVTSGVFEYGEGDAGPGAMTDFNGQTLSYDEVGQLTHYRGYDLDFDVQGRLARATNAATARTVSYHYDAFGDRRIVIVQKPTNAQDTTPSRQVYRYPYADYQLRDGAEVWLVSAGDSQVEITDTPGIKIDLALLNQLEEYVAGVGTDVKPLPEEYMDLDGVGGGFDAADLALATAANWTETRTGGARTVVRYYHAGNVGNVGRVTDSVGEPVSHRTYHPYGETAGKGGLDPLLGFTGQEIEVERDLGLTRIGARYYAADLGRWITPDRYIGQSPALMVERPLESNLYGYALNNPVRFVDPTGAAVGDHWAMRGLKSLHGSIMGTMVSVLPGGAVADLMDRNEDSDYLRGKGLAELTIGMAETGAGFVVGGISAGSVLVTVGGSTPVAVPVAGVAVLMVADGGSKAATGNLNLSKSVQAAKREKAELKPKKRGPKTNGEGPHNKTIKSEADKLEDGGNEIVAGGGREKEKLISTPGGHKSGRRPDTIYRTPAGETRGQNVGRTKADGSPVPREVKALEDLNGPGGLPTDFVRYD